MCTIASSISFIFFTVSSLILNCPCPIILTIVPFLLIGQLLPILPLLLVVLFLYSFFLYVLPLIFLILRQQTTSVLPYQAQLQYLLSLRCQLEQYNLLEHQNLSSHLRLAPLLASFVPFLRLFLMIHQCHSFLLKFL